MPHVKPLRRGAPSVLTPTRPLYFNLCSPHSNLLSTFIQVAKREFEAAIPLLRPTRKIFAELSPVLAAREECAEGLHVLSSLDETSTFDSVVEDVQAAYEKATGEPLNIA